VADRLRPAWAEIDVGAAQRNALLLGGLVGPSELCAVVKADGYGHGAVALAQAALAGGAGWLAVALVEEGVVLREAGIEVPILLLSEPPVAAMEEALAGRLVPTVYSVEGVRALGRAAAGGGYGPVDVHLKVNTGMHRVGADPERTVALATAIGADPRLRLAALWTHLAVADGVTKADLEFTRDQLARFRSAHDELLAAGLRPPLSHVANSAGAIAFPEARLDMVRCGIALYGLSPTPELAAQLSEASGGGRLEPVLSLRAQVSMCRWLDKGERPSYGRRRPLDDRSMVATVPLGYADGVPRRLFDTDGEVLIGGVRRPLAGVVTMDQIVVDCGADHPEVHPGDEVVFIGRQGDDEITATEWADRLGTINYEVVCGIGPRVPRVVVGADG